MTSTTDLSLRGGLKGVRDTTWFVYDFYHEVEPEGGTKPVNLSALEVQKHGEGGSRGGGGGEGGGGGGGGKQ